MAEETIFTKIIQGAIPCHKIYEDDKTFAFLDIRPRQPGHTLVIPKTPVEFVWDLEPEDYQALMDSVKKVAKHLREVMDKPYIGVQVVGVDVPHAHVHLIPFASNEEFNHVPDASELATNEELAEIAKKLAF